MYVLDLNALLKNYKMTLKNWRSLPFPLLIVIAFLARVLLAAGARLGGRVLLGGAAAGSLSGSDCSMQAGRLPLHKILLHSDMLHSAADDDAAAAQADHLAAAPLQIVHSLEAAVVVAMAPPHIATIFLLSR